ncbi:MAG: efflux RND transporter periplasmic adaptor subunit [Desulfatitalea sp.]|nr:efflux RND transporter periplasmic adaptor subunit [Desulfatitalea sp.]
MSTSVTQTVSPVGFNRNTRIQFWVVPILMALVYLVADSPPSLWAAPPAVVVITVEEAAVNPPAEYVGRTEAIQAVDLRARVEGFLEQVAFREGADVQAGDLLFVIEPAPYRARVREAEARVAEAEATHEMAQQRLGRLQAVRTGGVSATDLETATSNERQANARRQEANAALETARLNLGYTTIRAPISGRIGRTAYSRGNLVGPASNRLARIVQIDPIRVVYAVNEADLQTLHPGGDSNGRADAQEGWISRLRLPNNTEYPLAGRFDFIDNQVDPGTGTIAVRAIFDNPQGLLLPGQFVTVYNRRPTPVTLPVVPQSAVQADREGQYVFVIDDQNRAQLRRIAIRAAMGTQWIVESGLTAGETIVVQGVQKVTPGLEVTPSRAVPAKE